MAIFGNPYSFTHLIAVGPPHRLAGLGVDRGRIPIGCSNEDLPFRSNWPAGCWRKQHSGISTAPLPRQRAIGDVKCIEIRIPGSKNDFPLIGKRLCLNETANGLKLPFQASLFQVKCAEDTIAPTDIDHSVYDLWRGDDRSSCSDSPFLFSGRDVEAVDVLVRRAEHHPSICSVGRRVNC